MVDQESKMDSILPMDLLDTLTPSEMPFKMETGTQPSTKALELSRIPTTLWTKVVCTSQTFLSNNNNSSGMMPRTSLEMLVPLEAKSPTPSETHGTKSTQIPTTNSVNNLLKSQVMSSMPSPTWETNNNKTSSAGVMSKASPTKLETKEDKLPNQSDRPGNQSTNHHSIKLEDQPSTKQTKSSMSSETLRINNNFSSENLSWLKTSQASKFDLLCKQLI